MLIHHQQPYEPASCSTLSLVKSDSEDKKQDGIKEAGLSELEQSNVENHNSIAEEDEDVRPPYKLPPPPSPLQRSQRERSSSPKSDKLLKPYYLSEDTTTTDDDNDNNPNVQSYVELTLKRKTLLKIEKVTDSDSRSRGEMRSRGLSPPSSSDDENLYIGWVAYPKTSIAGALTRSRAKKPPAACACVHVFKQVFSPVTKVCKICKGFNKVSNGARNSSTMTESSSTNSKTKIL